MKELVLNLTRLGDVLQTQALVNGQKARGAETGLVYLSGLEQAVSMLDGLDASFGLPGEMLADASSSWRESLGRFSAWTGDIVESFGPSGLTNLTPSLSARLLARGLSLELVEQGVGNAPVERGFWVDAHGFGVNADSWSMFLQASSSSRGCSPFNLVDLFCRAGGLGRGRFDGRLRQPDGKLQAAMKRMLFSEASRALDDGLLKQLRGFVGLQLGASQQRRRWPVRSFAGLGRRLLDEQGLCPVLLGSRGEKDLGRRYRECGGPGIDLMGRTSLAELGAVVCQLSVLATNDTGTMHLAAGHGVPLAAVFLATAQPWDTGPYADGAICLEPDMACHPCAFGSECPNDFACRRSVTVDAMYGAICQALVSERERADEGQLMDPDAATGARIWRSGRETSGLMGLVSLSGHEEEDRTRWIRLQRLVYEAFLDGRHLDAVPQEASLEPQARDQVVAELTLSEQLLTLLEQQAAVLEVNPMEQMKKKFLGTWQRIHAIWEESRYFKVLGLMWACQSQEAGQDMARVCQVIGRYLQLVRRWKVLVE